MHPYAIAALTLLVMAALATVIVIVVAKVVGDEMDSSEPKE